MLEHFGDADDEGDVTLPLPSEKRKKIRKKKSEKIELPKKSKKDKLLSAVASTLASDKSAKKKLNIEDEDINVKDKLKSTVKKIDDRRRSLDVHLPSNKIFKRRHSHNHPTNADEEVFQNLQNMLEQKNEKSVASDTKKRLQKFGIITSCIIV